MFSTLIQVADGKNIIEPARKTMGTGNQMALGRDEQGRACYHLENETLGKRAFVQTSKSSFPVRDAGTPMGLGRTWQRQAQEVSEGEAFPRQGIIMRVLLF